HDNQFRLRCVQLLSGLSAFKQLMPAHSWSLIRHRQTGLALLGAPHHVGRAGRMVYQNQFEVEMRRLRPAHRRPLPIAALALCAFAPYAPALAQTTGNIDGTVTAVAGARPLSDVQVTIVGTSLGARTDDQGRYHIGSVPAGTHQLRS